MRILILTQEVPADAPADERDVLVQADAVQRALESLGHEVEQRAVGLDLGALLALLEEPPDVVFNLVESLGGHDDLQSLVPHLLELRRVPYTGCPAIPLGASNDKPGLKAKLVSLGLPTPAWATWEDGTARTLLTFTGATVFSPGRFIIKPARRHASFGIDDTAITGRVQSLDELAQHVQARERMTGVECFAERYVEGRELNLALLATPAGPRVLAFAEIDFSAFPPDKPRIVGYAAKWDDQSFEFHHTPRRFWDDYEERHLHRVLTQLVLRCWRELCLDGAVRIDLRIDAQGEPWILEVNANPCLAPDAGYMAAAAHAELEPADVYRRLVEQALARGVGGQCECSGLLTSAPVASARAIAGPSSVPPRGVVALVEGVSRDHRQALREILVETDAFNTAELDAALETVDGYHQRGEASGYRFLSALEHGRLVGYACFGPIPRTDSSYELFGIAVAPKLQGGGIGRRLVDEVLTRIKATGGTRLYLDTSSRVAHDPTRAFCARVGFHVAATFEDYYRKGDGKIVFVRDVATAELRTP